ncbi:nitrate- and nitrite sensing domain-containing protein [Streptomyces bambusae]|uniref:sensor histidine kinase n=1 Tax=Streptomyces bambusae TaxID=1550616 RepID=UPI001CFC76E8|nr:nitrate- and nitrite sensing domain-containing protein [Streptomyces bambusae]MCB5165232.1 nitrate- and nitrite sensing domain-containing protein [Streptomyces bambusae]
MRFRGKSIRRKIVALLVVPLVSLTALWGFATVITGREAAQLLDVAYVIGKVGYPIEDVVRVLQKERRQTLVVLGDPRSSTAVDELQKRRAATDREIDAIRVDALDPDVTEELSPAAAQRLRSIMEALDGIDGLRGAVDRTELEPAQALELYNRLVDPCYAFLMNLHALENVEMDKQGRALVGITRARETLSREDAVVAAALAARSVSSQDARLLSDYIANRKLLYETNLAILPARDRQEFEEYWRGPVTQPLRDAEEKILAQGATRRPRAVDHTTWDTTSEKVLHDLAEMGTAAGDRYQARVEPVAFGVLAQAAVAGVLGFLALGLSVFLSVRIGRELVRDLSRLRKEAHEVSGVRLPAVMRRLAAGEQVDVETEAPRLEYEKDEVGQVGQALNTLQRAAVEAAVKQAAMRRGVSEVFVNLARRNQVLLHRQLTLLDAMERRTEDSEELADLFRLDHMTTRMRRHAEGLVILSGAAPSRQWRKPVQLMDVVRAAVAEVEDYERIEVRRLPRLGITGPAVADVTHLVAELLENATVFSPPHTAVQVLGERVANGFTLEIHDRGLGMNADALLDANLRLAETPEFELSDTDRLGLFVVSRLARRQSVRVSLQPSPYGGTTAVVFLPAELLTEAPDTNGVGFRLDGPDRSARSATPGIGTSGRTSGARGIAAGTASPRPGLTGVPAQDPTGPPAVLGRPLNGPVELEGPLGLDGLEEAGILGPLPGLEGTGSPRGGLLGTAGRARPTGPVRLESATEPDEPDTAPGGPLPLPRRRRPPTLVAEHGRRVAARPVSVVPRPADDDAGSAARHGNKNGSANGSANAHGGSNGNGNPDGSAGGHRGGSDPEPAGGLPRRVRQASLAPQLKDAPARRVDPGLADDRDADQVRSRMAALQRGWTAARRQNEDRNDGPNNGPNDDGNHDRNDGRNADPYRAPSSGPYEGRDGGTDQAAGWKTAGRATADPESGVPHHDGRPQGGHPARRDTPEGDGR